MNVLLILFSLIASAKPGEKIYRSAQQEFKVEIVIQQNDVIWGFDFLDRSRILFTERGGKLKILNLDSKLVSEVSGVPEVRAKGQGGLLDVRTHPSNQNKIYLTYSEPVGKKATTTSFGFGMLKGNSLTQFKKVFAGVEPNENDIHFGSRIEFGDDGHIFATMGDRDERKQAQSLKHNNGKIMRFNENGSIPKDNPFVNAKNARPEIWSYGHRNPQGLVRDAKTGALWSTEMGPRGGDELNMIKSGSNYGWPLVTFGKEYTGGTIGEGTGKKGVEAPITYWVPSISPSALTIYTGQKFSKWASNIFIACLGSTHLRRLILNGNKVIDQEELLADLGWRFRNVRTGLDGFLYLSTDDGKIARLVPVK